MPIPPPPPPAFKNGVKVQKDVPKSTNINFLSDIVVGRTLRKVPELEKRDRSGLILGKSSDQNTSAFPQTSESTPSLGLGGLFSNGISKLKSSGLTEVVSSGHTNLSPKLSVNPSNLKLDQGSSVSNSPVSKSVYSNPSLNNISNEHMLVRSISSVVVPSPLPPPPPPPHPPPPPLSKPVGYKYGLIHQDYYNYNNDNNNSNNFNNKIDNSFMYQHSDQIRFSSDRAHINNNNNNNSQIPNHIPHLTTTGISQLSENKLKKQPNFIESRKSSSISNRYQRIGSSTNADSNGVPIERLPKVIHISSHMVSQRHMPPPPPPLPPPPISSTATPSGTHLRNHPIPPPIPSSISDVNFLVTEFEKRFNFVDECRLPPPPKPYTGHRTYRRDVHRQQQIPGSSPNRSQMNTLKYY